MGGPDSDIRYGNLFTWIGFQEMGSPDSDIR